MMTEHDHALFALAARQHFLVSRPQVLALGMSEAALEWRLERGLLERVHREVYRIAGFPKTWEQQVMAATLAAGEPVVASHMTAAALWGLPDCDKGPVEVTIPRGHDYSAEGVIVHEVRRLPPVDMTVVSGIAVTAPARVAFDLAARVAAEQLEEFIDDITGRGLATPRFIEWRLRELGGRGVAGTSLFRDVLLQWMGDGVSMTVFERRLFRLLDGAGVGRPIPQAEVTCPSGKKRKLDYLYPDEWLGLEAHSRKHHGLDLRRPGDLERHADLTATGLRIMYVRWIDMVARPDWTVAQIVAARAAGRRHASEVAPTTLPSTAGAAWRRDTTAHRQFEGDEMSA
jgi:hypothetical protein